jgi:hypothetical protein
MEQKVIYTVEITDSNKGNWYHNVAKQEYEATLEIVTILHDRQRVVFQVLNHTLPLRYILLHHAKVKGQRLFEVSNGRHSY